MQAVAWAFFCTHGLQHAMACHGPWLAKHMVSDRHASVITVLRQRIDPSAVRSHDMPQCKPSLLKTDLFLVLQQRVGILVAVKLRLLFMAIVDDLLLTCKWPTGGLLVTCP